MAACRIVRRACDRYLDFEGEGRTRAVYSVPDDDRFVLKIPKSDAGYDDNLYERRVWTQHRDDSGYIKYAACYLIWIKMVPVLIMERAHDTHVARAAASRKGWIMSVDCMQVGVCADGALRAFDYGCS